MHRSVVIGTVVSLVQAGWVGIETDEAKTEYVVTALGRDAVDKGTDQPFDRKVDEKHVWIVLERLEGQMARGKVRPGHAEAMAQAFWGMFFAYAIGLGILAEPVQPEISTGDLVAQFVDIFVEGTINHE